MVPSGCRVAVVLGGVGGERHVSRVTGTCVARHLSSRFLVKPVEILADGRWCVPAGYIPGEIPPDAEAWFRCAPLPVSDALSSLVRESVDVVFNALHGPGGEDGSFQGLLRHLGLPFTGPDVTAAAVTMDKRLTKEVLGQSGIRTPPGFLLRLGGDSDARCREAVEAAVERGSRVVPGPWFLKPVALGSSVAVEFIRDGQELVDRAVDLFRRLGEAPAVAPAAREFLVETKISGRELTCGVLETNGKPIPLPPVEIRPVGGTFFDYHSKYTRGATEEICPAPLTNTETRVVQEVAVRAHQLFRSEPLSRTDLFLEEDGRPTVLEINTLPGMTETSLIPLSAERSGMSLTDVLEDIVGHALRRGGGLGFPL